MRKILPFKHPTYKSLINRNIMQLINRKCWGCCYRNIKTFLLLITLNWREVRSEEWGYSLLQSDWGGSLSLYTWDVSSYWHALFFCWTFNDSQLRWSPEDWAVVVVGSVVVNWILSRQFPLLCSYRPNLTWSISLFDCLVFILLYCSPE